MAPDPLLRRRLTAQGLTGPPGRGREGPVAVAERLLGIQAQDPRGARLAIRARTRGTTGAHVDAALTEERSLVLTWLNRGTLHLVRAEDYPLLQGLLTPPLRRTVDTRLAQTGVDASATERAVGLLDRWLADEGPLSRAALRTRLDRAGIPVAGQGFVHILFRASLDGVLVRGPVEDAEQLYARVADWLPEAPRAVERVRSERERGLRELALRYLAGHAPADARDLAKWAGIGLGDARRGLRELAGSLRERADGLLELAPRAGGAPGAAPRGRLPPPRLLGAFEPLLMGWCSRAQVLGEHEPDVVTGGIFRGFALAGGQAVGVWRFAGASVALEPFGRLAPAVTEALERDGTAVTQFLGR